MANEVTVPLLPCRDIDEIDEFYTALGFHRTYRQTRPNPYLALRREDLHLHFFGMPGVEPAESYSTCLVLVEDIGELYRAFAAGMRAAYGKVLVAGIPRMTRPRPRKNNDGLTGFAVIDPGGNWIRISATAADRATGKPAAEPTGRLARALQNAVVLADSKGDHRQAARILDAELARPAATDDPVALVEALVYRAEVALTLGDAATAATALARAHATPLTVAERKRATQALAEAADLGAG
jgi:catechol 2,3-dioxygenase-like lactoylglutathione lyase family enzyme